MTTAEELREAADEALGPCVECVYGDSRKDCASCNYSQTKTLALLALTHIIRQQDRQKEQTG